MQGLDVQNFKFQASYLRSKKLSTLFPHHSFSCGKAVFKVTEEKHCVFICHGHHRTFASSPCAFFVVVVCLFLITGKRILCIILGWRYGIILQYCPISLNPQACFPQMSLHYVKSMGLLLFLCYVGVLFVIGVWQHNQFFMFTGWTVETKEKGSMHGDDDDHSNHLVWMNRNRRKMAGTTWL